MSRNRRSARRWPAAMLMLSALSLTACAKPSPVVVLSESRTIQLEPGQAAPFGGWLLSDGALVDLMECCADQLKE